VKFLLDHDVPDDAVNGIEAFPVDVEVNSGWGLRSSSSPGCRMRR